MGTTGDYCRYPRAIGGTDLTLIPENSTRSLIVQAHVIFWEGGVCVRLKGNDSGYSQPEV